jgi:nicotinate (nicotinamide) nucleotide adenylyltransferase
MRFVHKAAGAPKSIAVLAGAFNPPTAAHLALATAALDLVDQVILAIPRSFPHKQFEGATLEQRLVMLQRIAGSTPSLSAAVADGGLFVEIAREARAHYPEAGIYLLCGRDAAERIVGWDYGEPDFASRMLEEFKLLVAPRAGEFVPPELLRHAVHLLPPVNYDECSSTYLRSAIQAGADWRGLIPGERADLVEQIYR